MDPIRLESGQTAEFREDVMVVQQTKALASYKMTAQHRGGGLLDVRADELDSVMMFLRQLEPLGYTLRNVVRVPS